MWALFIIFSLLFIQVLMNHPLQLIDPVHSANITENPHVCYVVKRDGSYVALGNILDRRRILTSLQQFGYSLPDFKVICGLRNQNEGSVSNSYTVTDLTQNFQRNIAVLKLDRPIFLDDTRKPIKLNNRCQNDMHLGARVVFYDGNGLLVQKDVEILPDMECKKIPSFDPKMQTCAITQNTLYQIDNGGGLVVGSGLVVKSGGSEDELYGIFASGNFEDTQLFERIGCHKTWIDKQFTKKK